MATAITAALFAAMLFGQWLIFRWYARKIDRAFARRNAQFDKLFAERNREIAAELARYNAEADRIIRGSR